MAEAYGKKLLSKKYNFYSAGIEKHGLNLNMLRVLKEDKVDTLFLYSKTVEDLGDINFDYVITLCDQAKETCPIYLKKTNLFHKGFEDPARATGSKEEILNVFRKVKNEIKNFIRYELENILK